MQGGKITSRLATSKNKSSPLWMAAFTFEVQLLDSAERVDVQIYQFFCNILDHTLDRGT